VSNKTAPCVIGRQTVDFPQHYPKAGWVEHDLDEVWRSVEQAIAGALERASAAASAFDSKRCLAIGITNQRETLCVFDRKTGKPLRKAIVWQCRRSTEICERLTKEGFSALFENKTGLVLDPYF